MPAELVGKWAKGSATVLSEQNMTTGSISSRYGDSCGYTINGDGTYYYAALLKSPRFRKRRLSTRKNSSTGFRHEP